MFHKIRFAPDGAGGDPQPGAALQAGQPATGGQQNDVQAPETFETLYEGLDEAKRGLVDARFTRLENAVQATRAERDALSTKLAEVTRTLGKDPTEAKRLLDEMTGDLAVANQRAAFAEEAIRPDVGCVNPKAAWALAQADKLFDRRGNPDWSAIKAAAPELFRTATPPGNAGTGTGQAGPPKVSMDDFIRQKAGVRT